MRFYLKWKDEVIAPIVLDDAGVMTEFSTKHINDELAPLAYKSDSRWLKLWWSHRAVPISQGRVDEMLKRKGLIGPEEYLMKNLGLSLTDCYWICPVDKNLKWRDINLFTNEFKDNILLKNETGSTLSPNSSLQGELEKSWIIRDGKRLLVKGNHNAYATESINEMIASLLHKKQGYVNYCDYGLIKVKNKEYEYACYSEAFTSEQYQLVSAWDLITSEKKSNDVSNFDHLIAVAEKNGLAEKDCRDFLEYEIMSDYALSNRDRHMNNIGFLFDADTHKIVKPAPIYDSGKSMFVGMDLFDLNDLSDLKVNSFANSETKLLSYVRDLHVLDVEKLPTEDEITGLYAKDSRMSEQRINKVCELYRQKVDMLKQKLSLAKG